jgi:hypothetical protein
MKPSIQISSNGPSTRTRPPHTQPSASATARRRRPRDSPQTPKVPQHHTPASWDQTKRNG